MLDWVKLHETAWTQIQVDRARGRLSHALLISGPAGIGKLQFAEMLADSLLCDTPLSDGRACGVCTACTWQASGNHPDFRRIRPEAFEAPVVDVESDKPASTGKADRKKANRFVLIRFAAWSPLSM